jgi:hypothetical protein
MTSSDCLHCTLKWSRHLTAIVVNVRGVLVSHYEKISRLLQKGYECFQNYFINQLDTYYHHARQFNAMACLVSFKRVTLILQTHAIN